MCFFSGVEYPLIGRCGFTLAFYVSSLNLLSLFLWTGTRVRKKVFPGVLLMFLQQFASKTIFLAYIRLLAILGGSQRGSDKAEALEEVFGCFDAHSQTEVEESLTWKYVDHATDLAQLKWSSVGEVQECHRQNLVVLPQAICSEVHLEVKGVLQ